MKTITTMRAQDLNTMYEDTCVKVYDPNAEPRLIGVFKNYARAGQHLGISAASVQSRCCSKTRVYSPMLDREVALRLSAIKEGDPELIRKNKLLCEN
jgi:hypothetical protein